MTGKGRKLFIGGLPGDCDEKALQNAFANWETEDGKILKSLYFTSRYLIMSDFANISCKCNSSKLFCSRSFLY